MRELAWSLLAVGALASPALATDAAMLRAAGQADAVVAATATARAGSPGQIQRAYGRARDMREALRAAGGVSQSCRTFAGWAVQFADASVAVPDWLDRLDATRARAARRSATAARARMRATRGSCRPSSTGVVAPPPPLTEPRPGAAFFGDVTASAPAGTDSAVLIVDGREAGPLLVRSDGSVWARLRAPAGKHTLEVRFRKSGTLVGTAVSAGAWMLPSSATRDVRVAELDVTLQRAVRAAADGFDGTTGVYVHELGTGRAASWNAGARFPAASTVKLGVMVEALRRTGTRPEAARTTFDVGAIGGWSSNLAVNRLLPGVGGAAPVQARLRSMGATRSTFTGGYQVATAVPPVTVESEPALATRRVTTAADLAAVMTTVHRAAHGERAALEATGMTLPQARLMLGQLLASDPRGDNAGLVRQAYGAGVPVAQKNGWLSTSQHTAAIVYTARGPVVVVITATGPGVTRARAARLGTAVVRALGTTTS